MKKLSLGLFLALAAAVLWPAAGLALTPRVMTPLTVAPSRAAHTGYSLPAGLQKAAAAAYTPRHAPGRFMALRADTGPCAVTGYVLDLAGKPLAGAEVDLWIDGDAGDQFVDWIYADATGWFTFAGVPATTNGELDVWPGTSTDTGFFSTGNTFVAGSNDFTVRPSLTGAELQEGTDDSWLGWDSYRLYTLGSGGGGISTINGVPGDEGYVDGSGFVMAPDYDYAVAYPWANQGIEWFGSSPPVTPGASDGHVMVFDQDNGRSEWIYTPYRASGKPGTKVALVLENWPVDYQISLYGVSQAPAAKQKDFGSVTSDGSEYGLVHLTVPSTAAPGYDYELHAWRSDTTIPQSRLDLTTYFQVATLKASRSTVKHGGSVRLSGIVPTQGHAGSKAGKSKSVILYQRTTSAGQPTTTLKGWHKVATLKANGLGKYASRLLHPKRTTWYVVHYPGDQWYWGAYTSVIKVAVK